MEITSKFKTTLKKYYKLTKKGITKFLKKFGFSNKKSYKISSQIVNEMHGTIGQYIQRQMNLQREQSNLQQEITRNNAETFVSTSSLSSQNEMTINSSSSNYSPVLPTYEEAIRNLPTYEEAIRNLPTPDKARANLPTYEEAIRNLPTYEEAVADITSFDKERARRYKDILNEVNTFFAKETNKNWTSQSKKLRSSAQSDHDHAKGEDTEESELYSL